MTQRGNRQQDVFLSDQDRLVYLRTLGRYCRQHGVVVEGYCLMTNHVHLIAVPDKDDSLAKALGQAHRDYARWHNVLHGHSGHLWQNRFYSCPLEERHWGEALRCVELNPVRAHLVAVAWDWPWSSARAHSTGADGAGMLDLVRWQGRFTPARWREALELGLAQAGLMERIREATRTGRPFGSTEYVDRLEQEMGRTLRPKKRGRKPNRRLAAAGQIVLQTGIE